MPSINCHKNAPVQFTFKKNIHTFFLLSALYQQLWFHNDFIMKRPICCCSSWAQNGCNYGVFIRSIFSQANFSRSISNPLGRWHTLQASYYDRIPPVFIQVSSSVAYFATYRKSYQKSENHEVFASIPRASPLRIITKTSVSHGDLIFSLLSRW